MAGTSPQHDGATLRIAIADDHAVVRSGCRRLLELDPALRVVAEFDDGESAYRWLAANPVDLLILDLGMPGQGGLAILERLRQRLPRLLIVVFTMHESVELAAQALRLGASGYIVKSDAPETLAAAIREAAAGGRPMSSAVARAVTRDAVERTPHSMLSPREFAIFLRLASGASVGEIAAQFNLSAKTIANYQTSIRNKIGLSSSLDMHHYAVTHGLMAPPPAALHSRDATEPGLH